jgi:hypothetical protein
MRLYRDFASSAVRARPEGAGRRAQVRLQGPASVCGARPGCVRSLRRRSRIRRPMPRRTRAHLENMFWSSPLRPTLEKSVRTGRISSPADYPSACRSRAGHHGCFGTPSCKARRGRSADHGATSCRNSFGHEAGAVRPARAPGVTQPRPACYLCARQALLGCSCGCFPAQLGSAFS